MFCTLWNLDCDVIQAQIFRLIIQRKHMLVLFLYDETGLILAVMLFLTNLRLDLMPRIVLIKAWCGNFRRTVVLLISLSNLIVSVNHVFRQSKVFFQCHALKLVFNLFCRFMVTSEMSFWRLFFGPASELDDEYSIRFCIWRRWA